MAKIGVPSTTQSIEPEVVLIAIQLFFHWPGNQGRIFPFSVSFVQVEESIPRELLNVLLKKKGASNCPSWLFKTLKNIGAARLWQVVAKMVEQIVNDSGRDEWGSCLSSAYV